MDQQAVNKQIKQMVEFIKQEANEKAHEILIKAEEEFNIEKLRLVEQEKVKVRTEYERKQKQVEIQRRIAFSNEVNASRIKVLNSRDEVVTSVKSVVMGELSKLGDAAAPGYKDLCSKLVLQGLYALSEAEVSVICRKADVSILQGVVKKAADEYKAATGKACSVDVSTTANLPAKDDQISPCMGGVRLTNKAGTISVDNTLNGRMEVCLSQKLPDIKVALFGRSATRTHIDRDM